MDILIYKDGTMWYYCPGNRVCSFPIGNAGKYEGSTAWGGHVQVSNNNPWELGFQEYFYQGNMVFNSNYPKCYGDYTTLISSQLTYLPKLGSLAKFVHNASVLLLELVNAKDALDIRTFYVRKENDFIMGNIPKSPFDLIHTWNDHHIVFAMFEEKSEEVNVIHGVFVGSVDNGEI